MFRNYVKTMIRNLMKQKGYSLLNISGLALGLTCCTLLMLWVNDELSFDRFHENADRIYRVGTKIPVGDQASYYGRSPAPLSAELTGNYPEIIKSARMFMMSQGSMLTYGDWIFQNDRLCAADPSVFEIFSFQFINGSPATALAEKQSREKENMRTYILCWRFLS